MVVLAVFAAGFFSMCGFAHAQDASAAAPKETSVTTSTSGTDTAASNRAATVTVQGRVVDAATGRAIERFRVFLGVQRKHDFISDYVRWEPFPGRAFQEGRFQLDLRRPEPSSSKTYSLWVQAPNYYAAEHRVPLDPNEKIHIVLHKREGLQCSVRLPSGESASGAEVGIATPARWVGVYNNGEGLDGRSPILRSDADGGFHLPPQRDTYAVIVIHEKGWAHVSQRQIEASPQITLQPWARIKGTIRMEGDRQSEQQVGLAFDHVDGSRLPLPRHSHLEYLTGEAVEYTTNRGVPAVMYGYYTKPNAEGEFVFDRVFAGDVRVSRFAPPLWKDSHTVEVRTAPGEVAEVQVASGKATTAEAVVQPKSADNLDTLSRPQETAGSTQPSPASQPIDSWTRYVERFIVTYKLDAGQQQAAWSILRQLQDRAREHRISYKTEYDAANRLQDAERKRELQALDAPLDRMFRELKHRLMTIPTEAQRSAVAAGRSSLPSAATRPSAHEGG